MSPEEKLQQRIAAVEAALQQPAPQVPPGGIHINQRTLVAVGSALVALASGLGIGGSWLLVDAQLAADIQAHLDSPGHAQLIEQYEDLAESTERLADQVDDMQRDVDGLAEDVAELRQTPRGAP